MKQPSLAHRHEVCSAPFETGSFVTGKARRENVAKGGLLSRPGEGVLIDLAMQATREIAGGVGIATYTADISAAPVPHRRYSADIWSLAYSRATVRVLFGQEMHASEALRTLLVIKMNPAAAKQFVDLVDAVPSFGVMAGPHVITPEAATDIKTEPADTVAFAANFCVAAVAGREGCVDFYHASAFSKGAVAQTQKLAIDAIVRVDLRTSMMVGLVNGMRQLLKEVPPELLEA
jgi:hypothetical protein